MGPKLTKDKDINFSIDTSTSKSDNSGDTTNKDSGKNDERKQKMGEKSIKKLSSANTSSVASTEASILKLVKKHNKDCEDKEMIDACLQKHFFLRILDKNARNEIIKEMSLFTVDSGTVLFEQNQDGTYFYIIKEGEISVHINKVKIKTMKAGQSFGELALLHSAPRSATIISESNLKVWCMERRNFRKIIDHINNLNHVEIKKYLASVPFLSNIDPETKSILSQNLIKETYEKDHYIVKAGELAHCLYIIKEGSVECRAEGKVIRKLSKGEYFGEMSVLLETERTLDVVTAETTVLYVISVQTLKGMLGDKYRDILFLNCLMNCFQNSQYFNKINSQILENSYKCFKILDFKKGDVVLEKGSKMSGSIIAIIEGNLVNGQTNEIIASRGSILYENEINSKSTNKTEFNIISDPRSLVCIADSEQFLGVIGGNIQEAVTLSEVQEFLKKVPLFASLSKKKLDSLIKAVSIQSYTDGQNIITQGEEDSKFYIIKSGKVDIVVNKNYIRTLNETESFGERALFFKEKRSASAKANGKVDVYVLEERDFKNLLEDNLKDFLQKRLLLQDNTVEMDDLDYVGVLGSGNFGSVYLVQSLKNKAFYAIKGVDKIQINAEILHKNLELERSILLKLDHPFIVKLVKTLKDSKFIYFLMEHIKGKELFDIIREIGLLNKYQTQFYAGAIMLSIEYLHERKIIYRDIKPENIIINEMGYMKLIDFGTAKEITDRTTTIIGTPHYMAPEVIIGEGYTFAIDFWSVAICMFEFMCGGVPFGENADDPMNVYVAILNDNIKFPNFVKDKEFKHLINFMLTKNILQRCYKFNNIKNHPWFANFSWENLINMSLDVPLKPKLKPDDLSKKVPFNKYVKDNVKPWENPKKTDKIDTKNLEEYEKWFKNF